MPTNKIVLIISVFIVVVACGPKRIEIEQMVQDELKGLTKRDLLTCAGVPMRSMKDESLEFYTYTSIGEGVTTGMLNKKTGTFMSSRAGGVCEITVVLQDGRIEKISLTGAINNMDQCIVFLDTCLSGKPQYEQYKKQRRDRMFVPL